MNGEYTNLQDQPIVLPNSIFFKLESDDFPYNEHVKGAMIIDPALSPDSLAVEMYLKDLKKELYPGNIFGDLEPLEPKELTEEEKEEQRKFNEKMEKLQVYMDENGISIQDIKNNFNLYDGDYD